MRRQIQALSSFFSHPSGVRNAFQRLNPLIHRVLDTVADVNNRRLAARTAHADAKEIAR
jgi:hypothetical protein